MTWIAPMMFLILITKGSFAYFCFVDYLIFYTQDATMKDRDWVVEGVPGDRLSITIKDLSLETTYYFKVQAHNSIGYGPSSSTIVFQTPRSKCCSEFWGNVSADFRSNSEAFWSYWVAEQWLRFRLECSTMQLFWCLYNEWLRKSAMFHALFCLR